MKYICINYFKILQHLYESFKEEPGYFQFAKAMSSSDLEEIQTFLENAVHARYLYSTFFLLIEGYDFSQRNDNLNFSFLVHVTIY